MSEPVRPLKVILYGGGPVAEIASRFSSRAVNVVSAVSRQSILSAMNGPSSINVPTAIPSAERKRLISDVEGSFPSQLRSIRGEVDLLLLDLYDERFGVEGLTDSTFLTRTPGQQKYLSLTRAQSRHLIFGTEEHFELWSRSASNLLNLLASEGLLDKTILLDFEWAETNPNGTPFKLPFGMTAHSWNTMVLPYVQHLRDGGVTIFSIDKTHMDPHHRFGHAPFNLDEEVYAKALAGLPAVLQACGITSLSGSLEYDERHEASIFRWSNLDKVRADRAGRNRHEVLAPRDGTGYPLRFLLQRTDSTTLLVVSHGALNRTKYTLPRFEWLASMRERPENLLFLSDSGLSDFDDLELAWFTGDAKRNLLAQHVALVKSITKDLGISRIVFMGGSGGGFSALALSRHFAGSRALVFNPQTRIHRYWKAAVQAYIDKLWPDVDTPASLHKIGPRVDLISQLDPSAVENQVLYVQNSDDEHHVKAHLKPYAYAFGLGPESSVSIDGRLRLVVERFASGHNMPYRQVLNPFIDLVLTDWAGPLNDHALPIELSSSIISEP